MLRSGCCFERYCIDGNPSPVWDFLRHDVVDEDRSTCGDDRSWDRSPMFEFCTVDNVYSFDGMRQRIDPCLTGTV